MTMNPWLAIVLFGLAVFGFAWMTPKLRGNEEGSEDPAYERLLEELETENRELLDAVSKFKEEQDKTVRNLVSQIEALERQMKSVAEHNAAASRSPASVSAPADAAEDAADPIPAAPVSAPAVAASVLEPEKEAASDMQPAESSGKAPPAIRERYAELLAMHSKGKSVEQIAKSAGMNKGEVQLILQLAKREEEQLA